jgi:hypothetical protein
MLAQLASSKIPASSPAEGRQLASSGNSGNTHFYCSNSMVLYTQNIANSTCTYNTMPAFHRYVCAHIAARGMLCEHASVASTLRAPARPRGHEHEMEGAQLTEQAQRAHGRVLQQPSASASGCVRSRHARRGDTVLRAHKHERRGLAWR